MEVHAIHPIICVGMVNMNPVSGSVHTSGSPVIILKISLEIIIAGVMI